MFWIDALESWLLWISYLRRARLCQSSVITAPYLLSAANYYCLVKLEMNETTPNFNLYGDWLIRWMLSCPIISFVIIFFWWYCVYFFFSSARLSMFLALGTGRYIFSLACLRSMTGWTWVSNWKSTLLRINFEVDHNLWEKKRFCYILCFVINDISSSSAIFYK